MAEKPVINDEEHVFAESTELKECAFRKENCELHCQCFGYAKNGILSKYESQFIVDGGIGLTIEPTEHEYHIAIEKMPDKCIITVGAKEYLPDDFKRIIESIKFDFQIEMIKKNTI